MRTHPVLGLLAAVTVVVGVLPLTACSAVEGLARDALRGGGTGAGPCPSVPEPFPDEDAPPAPDPEPEATLDPFVARSVRATITAVRALPAVQRAAETTTNAPSTTADPACSTRWVTVDHFSSRFTVEMDADATPGQAGAVPTTMAEGLAWTGVDLTLTVPAGDDHVASVVHYDGTFDQRIPEATSTAVADGLATLAATPHVTGLDASIPYTMRVDYGSLTIGVDSTDQAVLDRVRAVIDTTAFRDTTLHGSYGNGAKP
ncbi:hypothetical protein [Curtobacterium sp. MCBA15_009]|uniref:hypothetical protein n=1 Tax=Curtobacterium sp. MCBA15_009 TaxID=1898737 RepID=UPI0020C89EE4|nr:hypothetical protein [Curtobacterium sp. MCBA15_009]